MPKPSRWVVRKLASTSEFCATVPISTTMVEDDPETFTMSKASFIGPSFCSSLGPNLFPTSVLLTLCYISPRWSRECTHTRVSSNNLWPLSASKKKPQYHLPRPHSSAVCPRSRVETAGWRCPTVVGPASFAPPAAKSQGRRWLFARPVGWLWRSSTEHSIGRWRLPSPATHAAAELARYSPGEPVYRKHR